MVIGGGGQEFCDGNTKALAIKSMTMGGGGLEIVKNCVTSFMHDPLLGITGEHSMRLWLQSSCDCRR